MHAVDWDELSSPPLPAATTHAVAAVALSEAVVVEISVADNVVGGDGCLCEGKERKGDMEEEKER